MKEPRACDCTALDQRLKFCPRHVRMYLVAGTRGRKTAIGPRNNSFFADDAGKPFKPVGHQFRMFDLVDAVRDDTWNEHFVRRKLDLPPDPPLVLVAGIRRLK